MLLPNFKGKLAEEKIKLIATREKQELLHLGFREGIFQMYDAASTGMINDLVSRLNQIDRKVLDMKKGLCRFIIRETNP